MADMSGFDWGYFGEIPAYGTFNVQLTGATQTNGDEGGFVSDFVKGAQDIFGTIKEGAKVVQDIQRQQIVNENAQRGIGANGLPITTQKATLNPTLLILGAALYWLVKRA